VIVRGDGDGDRMTYILEKCDIKYTPDARETH
jgi:hypothetical protein